MQVAPNKVREIRQVDHLLAVQIANSICIESKKKNITSNETDAPNGRQSAWTVSSVCTSVRERERESSVKKNSLTKTTIKSLL